MPFTMPHRPSLMSAIQHCIYLPGRIIFAVEWNNRCFRIHDYCNSNRRLIFSDSYSIGSAVFPKEQSIHNISLASLQGWYWAHNLLAGVLNAQVVCITS